MRYIPFLLSCILIIACMPAPPARAQRGTLIEDIFRTVTEAQLQREQRKRLERERELQQRPAPPAARIQPIPVPVGRGDRRGLPQTINTSNRQVADLAQHLVEFYGQINPLVVDLRGGAANNIEIRRLMPEAYQLAADTRVLIGRCDGARSIDPLIEPYSALDARWRQLSFQLRALDGLNDRCIRSLRTCDRLVGTMARCVGVEPQFDRHGLHDLMIIAATQMQALLDDLEIAQIDRRSARRLSHDLRILRQHILGEADRVDNVGYDEAVTAFTDFTSRWSQFSAKVYPINNPHLQRRLDRIRQCGDQTYQLLWIPPPYNAGTLTASAGRLQSECSKILEHLTIRAMVSLDPRDQVRLLEASRRMFRTSSEFVDLTTGNASRDQLQQSFSQIDRDWELVRSICGRLPAINQAVIAGIEHECDQLRTALGTGPMSNSVALEGLVQAAASLEGAAEYFQADLKRYERYLTPSSYRRSIDDAARKVYQHSKELHEALHERNRMERLEREAERLLDGWQELTQLMSDIQTHGVTGRRAESLARGYQNMAPFVAQIAASLTPR